jgi:hypothetical protein
MKKIWLTALVLCFAGALNALEIPINDINIKNTTTNQIFFVAWRGSSWLTQGSKSDYTRILPDRSKNFSSAGRSTLQVELGQEISDIESYRKMVEKDCTFKVTGSKVAINVQNGKAVVEQTGTLKTTTVKSSDNDNLTEKALQTGKEILEKVFTTVEVKNDSNHVVFITWTKSLLGAKYKEDYERLLPGTSKTFYSTLRLSDALQIEVGPKADKRYKDMAKKSTQEITTKRVDLSVDQNGYPIITQK